MSWLKAIARELVGLFVDDARFAVSVILWLCAMAWVAPHLAMPVAWRAPVLFLGLVAILVTSVLSQARRR